jgi:DNA-binding protein HU-beta
VSAASLLALGQALPVLHELDACRRFGRRWRLGGPIGRAQAHAERLGWLAPVPADYGADHFTLTAAGRSAIERLRAVLEPRPAPQTQKVAPRRPASRRNGRIIPATKPRTNRMPSVDANKDELADLILQHTNCKKANAVRALEAVLDRIAETVAQGGEVRLTGFGKFSRHTRAGSDSGRNPRTGEKIAYPATRRPHFRPGKRFRDRVATA